MRKILLVLTALLGFVVGLNAQVANDGCAGAINLGTLGTPIACNGSGNQGIGALSTFNLTNINALPESPYASLVGCQPSNGPMPSPAADVWYVVTVTGNALNVNITGLNTPSIGIYTGACGSLTGRGCAVGNAGSLNAVFEQMLPGTQVYIQISGLDPNDRGNFTLTLRNNNSCDDCMLQSSLTVSPQPVNGTYQNGTTVTFCLTINNWFQRNTNWIHGIVPTFGAGWDLNTLTNLTPAASCDGDGFWGWYNSVTSTATGNTFGPGFFYESNSPGALNGNPGDNFGDNCGQSGTSVNPNPNWVFCWTITTSSCPPGTSGTNLGVRINTLGDGESGAWTNFACSNDPDYVFSASLTCCTPPVMTLFPNLCAGDSNGMAIADPQGTGPYSVTWTQFGSGTVLQTDPNVTGLDTLNNLPAGTYVIEVFDSFDFCRTRDTVTILQPAPLSLTLNPTNGTCGQANASISTTVSGGAGGYGYAWSDGSALSSVSNLQPGTYAVTVTDGNGCQVIDSATVVSPVGPSAFIVNFSPVTCNGAGDGYAVVDVSGGSGTLTYAWSNSGSTDSIGGLSSGTFSVTVTDALGCSDVAQVTITEPAALNLTLTSQNISCNGNSDGWAKAVYSGGNGNFSLLWSNSSTQDSIGGLAPGTYSVTLTDTNTISSGSQLVWFESFEGNPAWTLNVSTGVNGADNNFWTISDNEGGVLPPGCGVASNGDQTLHITSVFCPTCGAAYDAGGLCGILFCPQTNMRAESPIINTTGFNNLILDFDFISLGDGLTDNASVWYNDGLGWQVLNPSIKSLVCPGGQGQWQSFSVALPASTWNNPALQIGFNWTNNDDGVGNDPSIAVNNARIRSAANTSTVLCTATGSVTITQPAPLAVTFNAQNLLCNNDSTGSIAAVVTGGNGNYHYEWSTTDTVDSIGGLGAGTYVLVITDTAFVSTPGSSSNITLYEEDFDAPVSAWNLNVPTGPNGSDPNFWRIEDDEGGVLPPGCGVANNGDSTLFITSVFCPTCGAAYDAGGLCGLLFCPQTNARAESPVFSTVGSNNVTLEFDFISLGDALTDNASVVYNDGLGWQVLNPSIKSVNCPGGQGQWTAFSAVLPASCWNNPTVQVGFNWTNNDDGVGSDPSVAINNLRVIAPQVVGGGSGFVLCTLTDSVTITQPTALQLTGTAYNPTCAGGINGSAVVTYSGGTPGYTVSWSNGFATDSISGLAGGNYTATVQDANGCVDSVVVTLVQPIPVTSTTAAISPLCAGDSNGCAIVIAAGGTGGYFYQWSNGAITDTVCGLPAGTYYVTVTDTIGSGGGGSNIVAYEEDFDFPVSAWNLNVATGPNGADNNFWQIDDDEGGVLPPGCGVANNGDSTLHITSVFCPTCGAAYDAGGLCGILFCPLTNMRAESPVFSTVGLNNVNLSFDYISLGDGLLDNASVVYNDGLGWQVLNPSIKTVNCPGGQGQWAGFTAVLPVSCWNNPTVQVGFNWTNNDDGAGADPSVAINNLQVIGQTVGGGGSTSCATVDSVTIVDPALLVLAPDSITSTCSNPNGSAIVLASGGTPGYSYSWNTVPVQTSDTATGLSSGLYQVLVSDANGCTDSVQVSVPDAPGPVIALDTFINPTCFNGTNGSATVSATGGTAPVSFVWNTIPPQNAATASGLQGTTYTAYAVDINNCIDSISVTLVSPPQLNVATSSLTASCNQANGTAIAVGSGGVGPYTYSWNTLPVQTGDTAFNLFPGNYTVTILDANGCATTNTVIVGNIAGPLAAISSNTNVSCNGGSDGTATASSNQGTLPFTFIWSNGQITPTATGLSAGTWFVTITDDTGCSDSTSVTITEPSPIIGNVLTTNITCNAVGPDGTAFVQASGGTGTLTYLWGGGQTTAYVQNLPAGNVSVTVTDANGCQAVFSGVIGIDPSPVVNAGGAASFCEGSGGAQIFASGTGGTPVYYYTWWCDSTNTFCGLDSVFDNDPIANPTVSTWYYVQITDANGCLSNIDSVFVTVLPKPIVDAGPDIYICGDSAPCVILNPTVTGAPGPYQYQWTPPSGLSNDTIPNPCARPDTTTIYTLQVTASNGCASFYNTVDTNSTVTVHVNPIPIAEAGPDRHLCLGDSVELQGFGYGAGPVYDFEWSPSTGLSNITIPNPMASPAYTTEYVLVVWSNGCPSYGDTVVANVHTIPTVDAGPDVEICLGETALMDAQAWGDSTSPTYNFFWVDNYGVIGSQAVEDLMTSPDTTHTYYVTATSIWGCESVPDSATVYVKPTPIAEAGPQQVICLGDSVTLLGGYYYATTDTAPNPTQVWFSWTPGSTLSDTTIAQPNAWPGQTQFYYLSVQYNTCITRDSVLVTVFPDLNGMASADTSTICRFDSVQLYSSGGIGGATFTWSPSTGLNNPNDPNPIASPDSSVVYTLVIAEGGCTDTLQIPISVLPTPVPDYINSTSDGCMPHTVSFVNSTSDGIFYVWNFNDGTDVVNTQNPTHTFTSPGNYPVTLTAYAPGGCSASIQASTIHVADTAFAEFASNPDFPVVMNLPNTSVDFINLSQNGSQWWWDFGDGQQAIDFAPTHQFRDPGEYMVTLTVVTAEGCQGSVIHGPYVVMTPDLFIPNVFTPNDDGINDRWLVQYTGSQPVNLTVYDRWGGLVYESKNKMEGWNGLTMQGDRAPEGVYYYYVRTGDREFTGEVTLMR